MLHGYYTLKEENNLERNIKLERRGPKRHTKQKNFKLTMNEIM